VITPKMKRRIKRELSDKEPTVWVGKNGISREVLAEIDEQLERVEMVKVRILKIALGENNAKTVADKIAHQTESFLVEVRGHTFMLYRKRKKRT